MKYIQPDWPVPCNIKAYTTLRNSWGERKPYHDKNHGGYTCNIEESQQLETLLQLPNKPIWLTQIHGNIVIKAAPENQKKAADASYATEPNQICAVLTADCLPILICNKQGTHVAAIHAGWRGLASGIIENTLKTLQQPSDELLAWLGPAIGPQKFEVGNDVYEAFTSEHIVSASAFTPHSPGKWLANLYELAKIRLNLMGISMPQIYGNHFCTYTQDELFFSYRRDKGKTGRMASVIWISPL
ncbi:MAG: peptidoglycan editing factor PgeF [Gammaproteobacteria bacterium]|nr:peptidoglycan editing factor PgeF [Gammaproteobacteria bacterium]MCW5583746.1 peptidoglycan editing factor PgeF [Gammaproteobacteria bacterium]